MRLFGAKAETLAKTGFMDRFVSTLAEYGVPEEFQVIAIGLLFAAGFFFLFYALPRFFQYLPFLIARALKFLIHLLALPITFPLRMLSRKKVWAHRLLMSCKKITAKLSGKQFYEINNIEDAMRYVRHLDTVRRANRLNPAWLYKQVKSEPILIEAAEALRKLSVIPDENGHYYYGVYQEIKNIEQIIRNYSDVHRSKQRSTAHLKKDREAEAAKKFTSSRQNNNQKKNTTDNNGQTTNTGSTTPWEVLEIARGANFRQIKKAYHLKMKEYHPDKVHHLGKDIQELAKKRTMEIREAFEYLKKRAA